jgi:hypothetical protein
MVGLLNEGRFKKENGYTLPSSASACRFIMYLSMEGGVCGRPHLNDFMLGWSFEYKIVLSHKLIWQEQIQSISCKKAFRVDLIDAFFGQSSH